MTPEQERTLLEIARASVAKQRAEREAEAAHRREQEADTQLTAALLGVERIGLEPGVYLLGRDCDGLACVVSERFEMLSGRRLDLRVVEVKGA